MFGRPPLCWPIGTGIVVPSWLPPRSSMSSLPIGVSASLPSDFPADAVPLLAAGVEGLAAQLLQETDPDSVWFASNDCGCIVRETFRGTLDRLTERFGPVVADWTWGRLHRLDLKHFLSGRGDLGLLLNQDGAGVRGDATTVCNTGRGPDFEAAVGAGFRMLCDLGESPAGLWMVDVQSQSGHCGSPHYRDQFQNWLQGEYHFLPLDREEARCRVYLVLAARSASGRRLTGSAQ